MWRSRNVEMSLRKSRRGLPNFLFRVSSRFHGGACPKVQVLRNRARRSSASLALHACAQASARSCLGSGCNTFQRRFTTFQISVLTFTCAHLHLHLETRYAVSTSMVHLAPAREHPSICCARSRTPGSSDERLVSHMYGYSSRRLPSSWDGKPPAASRQQQAASPSCSTR